MLKSEQAPFRRQSKTGLRGLFALGLLLLVGQPLVPAQESPAERNQAPSLIPDYTAREWHLADGLPTHVLTDLHTDKEGFLWIGTDEGLVRFDGRHFKVYALPLPLEQQSQAVHLLEEDTEGRLLVAPRDGGLLRFDGRLFEAIALPPELQGRQLTALLADHKGNIWAGVQRGCLVRIGAKEARIFGAAEGLDPGFVPHLALDEHGDLWLSSGTKLLRAEAGNLVEVPSPAAGQELYVARAREGGPWIVAKTMVYKREAETLRSFAPIPPELSAHFLHRVLETQHGCLLFGTRSKGLHQINTDGSRCLLSTPDDIYSIVEDQEGDLWVGSNGGGLIRLRQGILRRFDKESGLHENYSLTLCEDKQGTLWFANRDGGLARLKRGQLELPTPPASLGTFGVKALAPDPERGIWASSSIGLLHVSGERPEDWKRAELGLNFGIIRGALTGKQGDLWLACDPDRLVLVQQGKATELNAAVGTPGESIRAMAQDASGQLWMGTTGGRLLRGDASHFEALDLGRRQTTRALQALWVLSPDEVWVGTEAGGLLRWKRGRVTQLGTAEGLPSNNVTQLIEDAHGDLWLGSPHAIYHVARQELEKAMDQPGSLVSPVILGRDDGLPEASCVGFYQPSAWRSRDGIVWFATREGVVAIDPTREHALVAKPRVKVDRLRIDDQDLPLQPSCRIQGDFHKLQIEVAVLCLSVPSRVEVDYRLAGFDQSWLRLEDDGAIRFPRLSPGSYTLELRSRLKGGTAADFLAYPILIIPRWWQSWWFHGLGLVCGACLLSWLVRNWSRRRLMARLQRLEMEQTLERERTRIARNIHDDLGASLTRISLLTQAAQDGSNPLIDRIYETVSEITRSMDEIVWAVNPRYDTLGGLVYYVTSYTQKCLQDAGLRFRLESSELSHELPICSQVRHDLFLCCREALNNCLKHAKARELCLRITINEGCLHMEIQDNGRNKASVETGTVRSRLLPGQGLSNMRDRMDELGGQFEFLELEEQGHLVRLTLPLENLKHRKRT